MTDLKTAVLVRLGEASNRTFVLPLVIYYPTSRCNSRCVSCDWWRHTGERDMTSSEVLALADALPRLGTRVVVFSGGEPLVRHDVFDLAAAFRARGVTLHLLTSGILLNNFADAVAAHFSRVCVSLDAAEEPLYERIRGVAALDRVARGVARLRSLAPALPVTARSTLHRMNFRELPRLIDRAKDLGLDQISFLPADVSSLAFGRDRLPVDGQLALDTCEIPLFAEVVEQTIAAYSQDFESRFIAESPDRLRRLPQYYAALAGEKPFPRVECNAPWVSVVVEADGSVRPCFFHERIGSIRETPLATLVAENLRAFRRAFDVESNPVCTRCVCSLKSGWRHAPWLQ